MDHGASGNGEGCGLQVASFFLSAHAISLAPEFVFVSNEDIRLLAQEPLDRLPVVDKSQGLKSMVDTSPKR